MPTPPDGLVGSLWHVNFKVNCNNRGYNSKFAIVNIDSAAAIVSALAIAAAYKRILPGDAEIFYTTISNYNHARDSRFLRGAQGPGKFQSAAGPPVVLANFDTSWAGVKLRLENSQGVSVTRCINPVPDIVVTDEALVGTFTDVTSQFAGADPAEGDLTDYPLQLLNFMKILTKHSVHVVSGAVPGGAFSFWPIVAAYPLGIMKKKGSRAFV